ncbi:MAG: CotH kinase family protein [Bacteroidales bacterium]|nr:CotH kinase family protein [Bacteroidales bacterium]MCF8392167.1 CotH kinase family protein [Bacteroidales bacterium]
MINSVTRLLLLLIFFAVHSISFSQTIDHWETIIQVGDSCRYIVPDSEIGNGWNGLAFDDSGWYTGPSGCGYGDGDDNTELPDNTVSVYMRFEFTVHNQSDISQLLLDMDFDDGFVAYINGTEVARENVEDPITWNMELNNLHEALMKDGVNPERFKIIKPLAAILVTGQNVFAVEVHNEQASSSDLSANVFLHAGITRSDTLYGPLPDWFAPPVKFTEFNLPLMHIYTNGQEIPNEPRIVADMGLIYNGEDVLNLIDDPWNEYSGKISIETRGESSAVFAKKSFSIELQKADSSNNNVSILGLPKENDFVLYGPYSDKTMIKNVLTYELFRRAGRWAPRTRYIEVILNGEYEGVYVLTEKLKRDENRVDIDKLTSEDVSAIDISGGYILRRDKNDDLPLEEWWTSPIPQPYHSRMWYNYFDPDYSELTSDQANYIRNWMQSFDALMSGSGFNDPGKGYSGHIRVLSFIDMMFINEISKGIDNYLFSTYFYKENDADGGQLVAGPPWDYNLGYGNLDYGDSWGAKESYGWCYPQGSRVYWYERLMEDGAFRNKVYCRWAKHRESIYSDENIMAIINDCIATLGDAVDRNFAKFPTLGNYVWPGLEPYPETYEEEIYNLKSWLLARLQWMDSQWLGMGNCNTNQTEKISLSNNTFPDNSPAGTVIAYLNTPDPDGDLHDYSLVPGIGDYDNEKFIIEDNKLVTKDIFNFDTQRAFTIRLNSADDDDESIETRFTLYVSKTTSADLWYADENSFSLYPNPSIDIVQINCSNKDISDLSVQLIDLSGKVVLTYNGPLEEINPKLADDSRLLGKGMYFIKIYANGKAFTKKFIKL